MNACHCGRPKGAQAGECESCSNARAGAKGLKTRQLLLLADALAVAVEEARLALLGVTYHLNGEFPAPILDTIIEKLSAALAAWRGR